MTDLEGFEAVDVPAGDPVSVRSRIADLERDALLRHGEAAEVLRIHLDRYKSLVLALAQVVWTNDPHGEMVGEQPSWAAYTGQTLQQYQRAGWLNAVHPEDRARS